MTVDYRVSARAASDAVVSLEDNERMVTIPVTCDCNADTAFQVTADGLPEDAAITPVEVVVKGLTAETQQITMRFSGRTPANVTLHLLPMASIDPNMLGVPFDVVVLLPELVDANASAKSPSPVAPLVMVLLALAAVVARRHP